MRSFRISSGELTAAKQWRYIVSQIHININIWHLINVEHMLSQRLTNSALHVNLNQVKAKMIRVLRIVPVLVSYVAQVMKHNEFPALANMVFFKL